MGKLLRNHKDWVEKFIGVGVNFIQSLGAQEVQWCQRKIG